MMLALKSHALNGWDIKLYDYDMNLLDKVTSEQESRMARSW